MKKDDLFKNYLTQERSKKEEPVATEQMKFLAEIGRMVDKIGESFRSTGPGRICGTLNLADAIFAVAKSIQSVADAIKYCGSKVN